MVQKRKHGSSHHDVDQETPKRAKTSSDDPVDKEIENAIAAAKIIPSKAIKVASKGPSTPYTNNSSVTDDDIHTPPKYVQPATQPQTPLSTNSTNVSSDPAGRSIMVLETGSGVSAHFDLDGDYVVRVKRSITSSTIECNVKVTKELAQSAGMLAEILRDMGEQLLAQYRTSLQYVMEHSIQN